jgi:glycosyltransferase involved in cell wall biosynthesis
MKIVLIGPVFPYRGGIAHYTTRLDKALRDAGHDVLVISFRRQYPRWLFPGESDRDPSRNALVVDDARYCIDSINPFTWLAAFGSIRSFRPDVVVLSWWTVFLAPAWFVLSALQRAFMSSSLVVICHNVLSHEARRLDRWVAKVVLGLASRLIVQSDAEKRRVRDLLPNKPVDVVPHPVYDLFADQQIPREVARTRLGLAQDMPVLLFFGMIREYKGLSDILLALPDIRAHLGRVCLMIAGEFWENKRTYLDLIAQLGIGDLVVIEDRYIPNEDVPLYFSAADLLVAPYHTLTGSGVIQLAVGFDLPVVTTVEVPLRTSNDRRLIHIVVRQELANAIVEYFADDRRPLTTSEALAKPDTGWQELVGCIVKDADHPAELLHEGGGL